jgi:uncharacterized membrane protein YozB (DUF420 family)
VDVAVQYLPSVNAALNALAAVLLVVGWRLIKQGRVEAHKRTMLSAFAVSVVFLVCYVTYHVARERLYGSASVTFQGPPNVRLAYLTMLVSHVLLAACVPFLAVGTIYLGLTDQRVRHRRLARWTLPIWLYVSVTGVLVYVMLYHIYPSAPPEPIIEEPAATAGDAAP